MIWFFHNENSPDFARFPLPNSSPLRCPEPQSFRREIRIRVTQTISVTQGTALPCNNPLVVTTSRPQATMGNRQNSIVRGTAANAFAIRPCEFNNVIDMSASMPPHRSQFVICHMKAPQ
jgi:hypothetical protein